jgi:hypothetical protein
MNLNIFGLLGSKEFWCKKSILYGVISIVPLHSGFLLCSMVNTPLILVYDLLLLKTHHLSFLPTPKPPHRCSTLNIERCSCCEPYGGCKQKKLKGTNISWSLTRLGQNLCLSFLSRDPPKDKFLLHKFSHTTFLCFQIFKFLIFSSLITALFM